ncbi:MAG: DUF542 domain-containing protein [Chloroflexi bacterium]|nr:DUF542 domain-containing protein [Chloroflexota bacterium]
MAMITEDMVINEVIRRYPEAIAVFNAFRVDSCCGGGQSIKVTASADGVDVPSLLAALNATTEAQKGG